MSGEPYRAFTSERQAALGAVLFTFLAVIVWLAVAVPDSAEWVQSVDDYWHDAMAAYEWGPLVVLAQVFAIVGGAWVTVPLRVLVLIWLWRRKQWTGLLIWVLAVVPSQIVTTLSKLLYDRPRPDDRLMEAFTASFPSGHASNAAVMALAFVFVFVGPGPRRMVWLGVAVGYALVMAWTRTYLRVHWASDVTGGLLLGTACALWGALLAPRLAEALHTSTPASGPRT